MASQRKLILGVTFMAALMSPAFAQQQNPNLNPARPARIAGKPNFNGIWQAINGAYWNLEAHPAKAVDTLWQGGAITSIPAGKSVLKGGGKIPYKADALKQREENLKAWPKNDPEAKCFMLGVPRATYHNMPFQIMQGGPDMLMVYPFAATNRVIHFQDKSEQPADSWMGKSVGEWQGDVLVVVSTAQNEYTWLDRAGNHHSNQLKVTERFTLLDADHIWYEATMEDPETYTQPWTIEMPLYRLIEKDVQLLEHKCVPFADYLLYSDLIGTPKE